MIVGNNSILNQFVPTIYVKDLLDGQVLKYDSTRRAFVNNSAGSGSVTSVSVVNANGVSGTVATATTTPAISLTLGAITPTSVASTGTVSGTNLSGTNTGDQTITLTGDATNSNTSTGGALTLATINSNIGQFAATTVNAKGLVTSATTLSGDITSSGAITTLATVNSNIGSFTNASITVNAKGLITAASSGISAVTSVSGTTNRISSTGGATPVIDIDVAYVGQASITTLGTIGTGTWNATAITETKGGTAQTTYATGDTLYASGINTLAKRTIGSTGNVLTVVAGVPTWAAPATNGTVTSVAASGTQGISISGSPVTTSGTISIGLGAITPTSVASTGTVTGTNLSGTNTGDQTITLTGGVTGSGTGSFAATVVTNANLTGDVTSVGNATTVVTNANLTGDVTSVGNATTYTTVPATKGGTAQTTYATGDMIYASAVNTISKLPAGTNTNVLTLAGGIPTWAVPATNGTVTSVAASGTQGVSISGSPVTSSGTISIGLGAITPTSVASTGTVTGTNLSGTNTGDTVFGTAILNFGATPGTNFVTTLVTTSAVTPTSNIRLFMMADSTATHNDIEHMMVELRLTAGSIINLTSFVMYANTTLRLTGTFAVRWAIN